jgi:hypothetical protein
MRLGLQQVHHQGTQRLLRSDNNRTCPNDFRVAARFSLQGNTPVPLIRSSLSINAKNPIRLDFQA